MKKLLFVFMLIGLAWSTRFLFKERDLFGLALCGAGWLAALILAVTGALK